MNEQWVIRFVEHHAENLEDYFDWNHGFCILVCWNLDTQMLDLVFGDKFVVFRSLVFRIDQSTINQLATPYFL